MFSSCSDNKKKNPVITRLIINIVNENRPLIVKFEMNRSGFNLGPFSGIPSSLIGFFHIFEAVLSASWLFDCFCSRFDER